MLDAIETPSVHPFIWGVRGIGKTSLGHTTCEKFSDNCILAASVACSKSMTFRELVDDIVSDAFDRQPSLLKNKKLSIKLSAFGVSISTEVQGFVSTGASLSINQSANLIDNVFSLTNYGSKFPVIIIDEFDRLEDAETLQSVSDLLKQLSVISAKVKFAICGVTDDLGELLSAHQSVDRYIYGVELQPISHDAIWDLVRHVGDEFSFRFHRGQEIRIGQIAAGYPHFAHLVLKNTLLEAYENDCKRSEVSNENFRGGLARSSRQAATRLKTAYENAIRKGTDRYIEVLFAVANHAHMNRQFKDIAADYAAILESRSNREGYDIDKNNGADLRNALNSLHKRGFLKKGKSGWYQFSDPMLRSYVRLVAETEGVELSDESFPR